MILLDNKFIKIFEEQSFVIKTTKLRKIKPRGG